MYVCVCNAITEQQVNTAIEAGAHSVKLLNRRLGVGGECGACIGCAKACLKKAGYTSQSLPDNVIPISNNQVAA